MYMPDYLKPIINTPRRHLFACFYRWARSYILLLKVVLRSFFNHFKNTEFCLRTIQRHLILSLLFFKYDIYHQFCMCIDVITYDQPGKKYRFTIIYYLLSILFNTRLHLVTQVGALQTLETACMIYKSINWSEREIWDMFGIFFTYHPDLRRLLTDYGFSGFPLRKDFPVSGFKELIYSDFIKNTEYRNISLMQELRRTIYEIKWQREVFPFFRFRKMLQRLVLPTLIIYVTFGPSNIFIHWYRITKYGQFKPYLFMTLKAFSFAEKEISINSINQLAAVFTEMFRSTNIIAKRKILVLSQFGKIFKKLRYQLYKPNRKFSWVRRKFFKALRAEKFLFDAVLDRSSVPFNGCRTKKLRRTKFKRIKLRQQLKV